tara:strand:- start:148 stop:417 length:270 start_codon:yes stop_codon:yes gene_type:complete
MADDFVMELCGNKAAWQVVPDKVSSVDLEKVGDKISKSGYLIGISNRLCWTFIGPADLTLYPSGKLLIKTKDKDIAQKIAEQHLSEWVS